MRTRLAVLLALVPLAARAGDPPSYLFGLGREEILAVMDHYHGPGRYDPRRALAQMAAPFDCQRAGDACGELGEDGAYALMASAWRDALDRVPAPTLEENVSAQFEDLAERFLAAHYADGIPPRDPYLGSDPGGGTGCPKSTFDESGTGFAVRQKSGTLNLAFVIGGFSRIAFFEQKANGRWAAARAEVLGEKGSIFVTGAVAPQEVARDKTKEDAKHLTISWYGGSGFSTPYAEGCGSVAGPMALVSCTCSGPRPVEYGGSN